MLKAQWWDPDRLEVFRNRRLQHTLERAYYETTFYRELFDSRHLKPSDIKEKKDLAKLPVVTKEMLRNVYPVGCCRGEVGKYQEFFTSGSSGAPFVVRTDSETKAIANAMMLFRASFSGWRIGNKVLQTGMTLNRGVVKRTKDILLRVIYVSAFNLSNEMLERFLDVIDRSNIRYVMGYASSIYCLAEYAKQVGFKHKLSGVVTWGDNLYGHYRRTIEEQFGAVVTDTYGCGEGIQVAAQCDESRGAYHIFSPYVMVEFVEEGNVVSDGQLGDILLTRLNPGAMPLIRYSIGDVGRASENKECTCGRGLPLMEAIDGRNTDIIHTPSGNRLIVHFFTGILEYYTSVDMFQVVQVNVGEITIKIVPGNGFSVKIMDAIKKEIQEKGDPGLSVYFDVVSSIPLEASSKRRFVVSNL